MINKFGEFAPFFFQAEDGIRALIVTGVQTCALPIFTIYNGIGIGGTVAQTVPVTRTTTTWTTTLVAALPDGTYTAQATQNDTAVNTGAPSVTVNQAVGQVDPTNASPINFTVVFSEPVTGFVSGDVAISGTA